MLNLSPFFVCHDAVVVRTHELSAAFKEDGPTGVFSLFDGYDWEIPPLASRFMARVDQHAGFDIASVD